MFGEHLGIIAADTPLRSAIDRTLGAYRAEASCFTRSVHDMVDVGWAAARRALDIANERWPSRTTSRETVLWTLRRSSHLGGTGNQLGGQDRSLCARLDAMDADPSLSHIPVGRRPQMSTTMLLSDAHRLLEALASAVTTVTGHDLSAA